MRNNNIVIVFLATSVLVQQCVTQTWWFKCVPPKYVCKHSTSNLTSVPNNLIFNVTESAYLSNNSIAFINSTRDFLGSNISSLCLTYNKLTSFPCLPNIRNTLTLLLLMHNFIDYVDSACLSILTRLQLLELQDNFLSSFPDVFLPSLTSLYLGYNEFTDIPNLPLLGMTLTYLEAAVNPIQYVSAAALMSYRNLSTVILYQLEINTLPNMCALPINPSVSMDLWSNDVYCDCRVRWLKALKGTFYSPSCSGPPLLAGKLLTSVNIQNLTCPGKKNLLG